MPQHLALKDFHREVTLFRHRLLLASVILCICTFVLLAGLARLQIVKHDHFRTLSQENRVKILPIAPTRGLIFSREGTLLADNRPSYSLEITPERVRNLESELSELQRIIALDGNDLERFYDALKTKRRFESIPLRVNLNREEVARFSIDQYRFPGFEVKATLTRYYPLGVDLAHLVGYVARIDETDLDLIDRSNYSGTSHIGKAGVERAYESVLHGQVGYQQVEVNAIGRVIRVLEKTPPVPGRDIYLTLDLSLQQEALAALGDRRGAVVALDPETGGILAFVSTPGFDPNEFVNGIDPTSYAELRDSPDRPLFNRALQGQYPPGSTVKPFLALGALRHGLRSVESVTWCPGWYRLSGEQHRYRDWKREGHGHVDMSVAITQSCDVYFYRVAQDLGITRVHDFMEQFGFGRRTGIDLPGEAAGLMPSPEWKRKARKLPWYLGETLITGIGQGFTLATPLQLAVATAALARRGTVVQPHAVGEIEDSASRDAEVLESPEYVAAPEVSPDDWQTVVHFMEEVVHGARGTARRVGEGAPYRFAGKTGTSQLFGLSQGDTPAEKEIDERLRDHALFIAFAPADKPLIAVAIIVENGGSGSRTAAPIARKLFDHYLRVDATISGGGFR
jgi:penicillin-binding protein 2